MKLTLDWRLVPTFVCFVVKLFYVAFCEVADFN